MFNFVKVLLLCLLMISFSCIAESTPKCGKDGFSFLNNQLVLNSDSSPIPQRVFIIQNLRGYTVLINHNDPNAMGAHAGWATRLDGGMASAIAMGDHNFSLFCMAYNPPQFGMVNCQSVITVCAFPPQKKTIGNFWIAENQSLADIDKAFKSRGVF